MKWSDREHTAPLDESELLCLVAETALGAPTTSDPHDLSKRGDHAFDLAVRHGVTGLMVAAIESGRAVGADHLLDRLVERHVDELRRCLVIEAMLGEVSQMFDGAGVTAIVLKGVANAHLDHRDPSWRTFQDVDLLVPADQIDRAVRTLETAGFARDLPPRTSTWDRRFTKDLTLVGERGPECDLHRTLVPGAFGFWLDLDALSRRTTSFDLAGRRYRALHAPGRVLHAALALTVGEPTPKFAHVLDLALALRSVEDVAEVLDLARRSRAELLLDEAAQLAESELHTALDHSLHGLRDRLEQLRAMTTSTRLERVARRTYRSSGGSNTATLLGGILAIRGIPGRLAYVRGLAWPDQRYRAARRSSVRPPEWRTGARELLRTGRAQ